MRLPSRPIPWPRLCREVHGALVEVTRELRTRGGEVFRVGERLTVHHAHGSWLNLGDGKRLVPRQTTENGPWTSRSIGHVERRSVRLVGLSGGRSPRSRR
jgi:hypothetical protein